MLLYALKAYAYPDDILKNIKYNRFGRPFLKNIDFNISHSHNLIVCAISQYHRLGIDVEKILPINFDNYSIAMNSQEWHNILKSDLPYNTFYHYWTSKESFIKAIGVGMRIPLTKIDIKNNVATYKKSSWHQYSIHICKEYKCTLSVNQKIDSKYIIVKKLKLDDIISRT